jgi:uncharacterized protein (TIGR02246 family)
MNSQTRIQNLIENYRQAVMAKDIEKVMALYADDIVSFDAVKALQFKGKPAYRAHWQACMEMCAGPHTFEFEEISIESSENVAFAHWLAHCGGTNEKGETQACWMRVSQCYRQEAGLWQIVHEHWSAPFDMQTGATLFDLKP